MNKKRIALVALAAILLLAAMVGGTMAYFRAETSSENKISAGRLGIELVKQVGDKESGTFNNDEIVSGLMPGDIITEKIWAVNSKDKDLYVKVTLKKYWEDSQGNKVLDANADYIRVTPSDDDSWIIHDTLDRNKEEIYFYYKAPLTKDSAGNKTTPMINQISITDIPAKEQSKYIGLNIKIEAYAEAVQSIGDDAANQDAVLSQWGQAAVIENNKIISIEE